jgi:hypothetical protein
VLTLRLAVWVVVPPLHLTRPLTNISRGSTLILARRGAVGSGVYARSRVRCDMPRGYHWRRPGQPGSSFWWTFSHETMLCCPVCTQDVCLAPARSGPHSVPMPRVGNSFQKQARTFSLCSRAKPGRLFFPFPRLASASHLFDDPVRRFVQSCSGPPDPVLG